MVSVQLVSSADMGRHITDGDTVGTVTWERAHDHVRCARRVAGSVLCDVAFTAWPGTWRSPITTEH